MITVIIPLYNKELSIAKTLNSVLEQSNTDFECLIVNDGSTDNSNMVVSKWLAEFGDERFRIVNKENEGVSSARNRGVKEARGEYIAFLDGDDLWHKDFLHELALLIQEFPSAAIYGIKCKQVENETLPVFSGDYERRLFTNKDWRNSGSLYTGSSTCIRKSVIDAIGEFDTRMTHGEDLDMWWRVLTHYSGAYSEKPLAYYRQDAENRAMYRLIPLEKHIPYYMNKFRDVRNMNKEFCVFFDTEMIYKLYPYLFDKQYQKQAKKISRQINYTQLRFSLRFRMVFPRLYRFLTGK